MLPVIVLLVVLQQGILFHDRMFLLYLIVHKLYILNFAVTTLNFLLFRHGLPPHDIMYGTTAEIYEYSDEMGTICIKAKGRQRFKLLQSNISTNSR